MKIYYSLLLLLLLPAAAKGADSVKTADGQVLTAAEACERIAAEFVVYKKGSKEILPREAVLVEDKRVAPALKKTLEHYFQNAILPPSRHYFGDDAAFSAAWQSARQSEPEVKVYERPKNAIEMKKFKDGASPVFDTTIDGKRYAFRTMKDYTDLRKSVGAAEANRFLGLDTAPQMHLARVNGELGYLADYVDGIKLPMVTYQARIKRLLEAGSLNPRSYSDAMAFEFLFANGDASGRNTRVTPEGKVYCIDHNMTASYSLADFSLGDAALGTTLPEKYTSKFVQTLRALSRDNPNQQRRKEFRTILERHLTPEEVEAVFFRLDVILEDIKLRGDAAIF